MPEKNVGSEIGLECTPLPLGEQAEGPFRKEKRVQMRRRAMGAVVAMGITSAGVLDADEIPFREALMGANVELTSMTNGQHESLILGNGDLYGIVWNKGGLYMRITKNDIWDARVDTSKDGPLPDVDVRTREISGSKGAPPSYKKPYPHPRCAVALRLGPAPAAMTGTLDLKAAVISVTSEARPHTTVRVLNDRNVVLVRNPHPVVLEEVKSKTLPAATTGTTDGVAWLHTLLPGDMDYAGMQYAAAVAGNGNLKAVSLVTSFDIQSNGVLEAAIALAKRTVSEQEATLVASHEAAWQSFWSRSGIRLDDDVLQRWWYRQLYFARTICRPGSLPVGLMPPLATDATPWHADYHHNYNMWQVFWPLPAANQPELVDPWITYVHSMLPRFKHLAKQRYGLDGACFPISSFAHEPDPAVCKSNNRRQLGMNPWGLTIGMGGMTVQSMWQKYLCDQDIDYMREKIYPTLRETARFYVNFMDQCGKDEDGKVLLGPSYSPEHGPVGIDNCPYDIGYVRYTFDALIEASSVLSTDADLAERCRTNRALLGSWPTAIDKAGQPVVVDWLGCKGVGQHNIEVPSTPVFPCDQVTWFSPKPEKELFRRTILNTRKVGANSHVMYNVAQARLSMPNAIADAKRFFGPRELPNGLIRMPWAHGTFMSEQIGVVGLINELLLQSVDNKIRVFPAWPKDQDAAFARLRTQGGFIVSAEFRDGRVASATVESVADRQLQLLSPWKAMSCNGKQTPIGPDGLVTLETEPGQILSFTETAN